MPERMTGGDAIVQSLLAHGVDTVFAIPGVQTYEFFDALYRAGDAIRLVVPRHEQATAYMAYGYSRATGRVGVFSVVPGPGVLNATAAICTAYGTSTPLLCVTGEVPSAFLGSGKGHLHELPDQLATLRSLTKWAARIDHPAEAPALVAEAFRQATGGRPRPVALEMPWDVFGMRVPVPRETAAAGSGGLRTDGATTIEPDPDTIDRAAALLKDARNPMIMVGGGAQDAAPEVLELAEFLQAPVVPHLGGRGVVSDDHHLGFTLASGYRRRSETDVVIGIGSRLELLWFRWDGRPWGASLVTIDIDPQHVTRFQPDIGLVGDAAETAAALAAALHRVATPRASRADEFQAVKEQTRRDIQRVQPYMGFLNAIRDVLPRDGIFVDEICQAGFAAGYGFPVYEPRTYIVSGHQGTLGYGFPTALGVKVARPDRAVVSIAGDGGFQFGLQELATATQYGIGVVTVVFDNGAYGNVRWDQQRSFAGRVVGSELQNPDFVALAESFGVAGRRARTPAELRTAVAAALESGEPALVHVPIEPGSEQVSPWEFIMPAYAKG